MMLLFCAKHILHNNLPVSVYLVTSVLPSADMWTQPLTDCVTRNASLNNGV